LLLIVRVHDEGLWSVVGGTIHRPFRGSPTAQDAQERRSAIGSTGDLPGMIRRWGHDFALGVRRVPGSRIVGPFSVSRCA